MNPITIKPDAQGKVRDIYDLGDTLLFVATDRISAFDYILEDEIPHKGQVLTQISCFWFELLEGVVENHLVSSDVNDLPEQFKEWSDYLNGRFMIVKKAQMIPIECIVRGYLTGSGFKDYQKTGSVCGIELPSGLQNSAKLPQTLFTPSTKAEIGDHDENISFERAVEIVGEKAATDIRDLSLKVYETAAEHAPPNALVLFVLSRRRIVILAVELGLLLASGLLRSFLFLRSLLRGLHVHARRGFRLRLERRGRFLSLALRSVGLIAVVHRVSCAHMDTFLLENTW